MPIPFPDNLTPFDPPYTIIAINNWWFSLVWGLLGDSLAKWNWSVTDEQWETQVQDAVIKLMGLENEMLCDPCGITIEVDVDGTIKLVLSPEISVNTEESFPTNLTYDPATGLWSWSIGETTYQSGDISIELPDIYENGAVGESTYPEDNVCAGVYGAVDWLLATITDEVQIWIDEWQDAKAATEWLEHIIASVPGVELLNLGIGTAIDVVFYIHIESMTDAVTNMNNTALIEQVKQELYCAIIANNSELTQEIFEDWCDNSLSVMDVDLIGLDGGRLLVSDFAKYIIQWRLFHPRFRLHSADSENDCRLLNWCGDGWAHYWDFSEGQGTDWIGFAYGSPPTTWAVFDMDAWKSVYGYPAGAASNWRARQNFLDLNVGLPAANLTHIDVTVDYTANTNDNAGYAGVNNVYIVGSGSEPGNYDWNTTQNEKTFSFDLGGTFNVLRISVVVGVRTNTSPVVDGECRIKRIAIFGTGSDPFA